VGFWSPFPASVEPANEKRGRAGVEMASVKMTRGHSDVISPDLIRSFRALMEYDDDEYRQATFLFELDGGCAYVTVEMKDAFPEQQPRLILTSLIANDTQDIPLIQVRGVRWGRGWLGLGAGVVAADIWLLFVCNLAAGAGGLSILPALAADGDG
jgi:hypothetical protein